MWEFTSMVKLSDSIGKNLKLPWFGVLRMFVVLLIAFGYASTMPRGPGVAEYGRIFGYDPSWFGIEVLFFLSGFFAMRSLARHNSGKKLLLSRALRNIPALALFAIMVIFVLFPVFGAPANNLRIGQHIGYFLSVVSCFNPGQITPGLLDNALYMCVINGGLWTFRWGAIAFIMTAIGWYFGVLKNKYIIAGLAVLSVCIYWLSVMSWVKNPALADNSFFALINISSRLGWIYLAGMGVYAWSDKIPKTMLIPALLFAITFVQYKFLPWTAGISISASLGFGVLVLFLMTSQKPAPEFIRKIPDLSLGIYIYAWPVPQILLLIWPDLTPWGLIGLSLPMVILLALASWGFLSRPINKKALKFAV